MCSLGQARLSRAKVVGAIQAKDFQLPKLTDFALHKLDRAQTHFAGLWDQGALEGRQPRRDQKAEMPILLPSWQRGSTLRSRMAEIGRGCVKTRDQPVFRGLLTIPDLEITR